MLMFVALCDQVQLADWKGVLNKLDQRLCNIMNKWRTKLVLSVKKNEPSESTESSMENDVDDLKVVLKFTAQLLRSAINKEVYNSTEVSYYCKMKTKGANIRDEMCSKYVVLCCF